jgi:hypothetical protein
MSAVKLSPDLQPHPTLEGWVMGWAVIEQPDPWSLVAVYTTQKEALETAQSLGGSYEALFGSHNPGTDDFILETLDMSGQPDPRD